MQHNLSGFTLSLVFVAIARNVIKPIDISRLQKAYGNEILIFATTKKKHHKKLNMGISIKLLYTITQVLIKIVCSEIFLFATFHVICV